jgi:hypothetical protein
MQQAELLAVVATSTASCGLPLQCGPCTMTTLPGYHTQPSQVPPTGIHKQQGKLPKRLG